MNYLYVMATILSFSLNVSVEAAVFKTEKWHTPNGINVVFYPAPEVAMLDVSLAFAAGSAYDETHYGLSSLTSRIINQGNAGQNANAIAESLADAGAQFNTETNRDMVVYNLRTLTEPKALVQAVTTFTSIINKPDFPQQAVMHEKQQLISVIEQNLESPEELAELNFFENLYHNHPYAHAVNGTKQSIQTISRNDIIQFYKKYYVGNNATLVLVGAINSTQAHDIAHMISLNLPSGTSVKPVVQAKRSTHAKHLSKQFNSSQTIIRLGQLGINHHHPDYFSLLVGNYILGGGTMVSRLGTEVREKRGLTYGVYSQFVPMLGDGPFLISLSTRNVQTNNALQVVNKVLHDYIITGPSEEELEAAKKYLSGSFPLSLSGNHNIATLLLRMSFYHLPDDFLSTYIQRINAVTKDSIKQAFKKHIHPEQLLLVTVGQS